MTRPELFAWLLLLTVEAVVIADLAFPSPVMETSITADEAAELFQQAGIVIEGDSVEPTEIAAGSITDGEIPTLD